MDDEDLIVIIHTRNGVIYVYRNYAYHMDARSLGRLYRCQRRNILHCPGVMRVLRLRQEMLRQCRETNTSL